MCKMYVLTGLLTECSDLTVGLQSFKIKWSVALYGQRPCKNDGLRKNDESSKKDAGLSLQKNHFVGRSAMFRYSPNLEIRL
jgi:hypothetical protein